MQFKAVLKILLKTLRNRLGRWLQKLAWAQKIEEHSSSGHITGTSFSWLEPHANSGSDRDFWVQTLYKITYPVIHHLAQGTLKSSMPLETGAQYFMNVGNVSYLEALGRTMAGVAPWMSLPDDQTGEGKLRTSLRMKLLSGLANSVNPDHADYMSYRIELQSIVDAAYVAHGFIRARHALWDPLDQITKQRFIAEFKSLRNRYGAYNNWLLFSAVIEVFLMSLEEDYDPARVQFAIEKMREWYLGDGWYSDGPKFSMDYYNSFVIHPMLVDVLRILSERKLVELSEYEQAVKRMVRYSVFLERMIMPDGTFAPIGRSITYRTGAFQVLSQVALMKSLPEDLPPAQVRCALTTVFKNMYGNNQNFDKDGWLVLGFNGYQPMLADTYTSTGSLYMATLAFLPLGLPADSEFWVAPARLWSAVKAWQGLQINKDYKVEY